MEVIWVGKLLENKHTLIYIKVSCNNHKLYILKKSLSLQGTKIFINEDLIPKYKARMRKEFQKAKEERKKGHGLSLEMRNLLFEIEFKIQVINKD